MIIPHDVQLEKKKKKKQLLFKKIYLLMNSKPHSQ